jgi:hypothetical protein
MNLDRKGFPGIEHLEEQRERARDVADSENLLAMRAPELVERFAGEGAAGDDALSFGTIDDFPGFTDGTVWRQGAIETALYGASAPDSFLIEGDEGEGFEDCGWHHGRRLT